MCRHAAVWALHRLLHGAVPETRLGSPDSGTPDELASETRVPVSLEDDARAGQCPAEWPVECPINVRSGLCWGRWRTGPQASV